MTRSVDEWVGATDDAAIPPRVKLRVWERCEGRCALSGRKLRPGEPWDLDHIIALANGGRHAESNLQVVSQDAHKAKTREDVKVKAKIARVKAKHLGVKSGSGFRGWRNFRGEIVYAKDRT